MKKEQFPIIPISGTKNRVYVESTKGMEKKSNGGIIISSGSENEAQTEGIVIAVSPFDEDNLEPNVQVGDHVIFNEHGYKELEYKGMKYLSMRESEITGKIII